VADSAAREAGVLATGRGRRFRHDALSAGRQLGECIAVGYRNARHPRAAGARGPAWPHDLSGAGPM